MAGRSAIADLLAEMARRSVPAAGLGAMAASDDSEAGVITKAGKRIIEAWHGSPHKFDKFSIDSIGTGEGAQSYGHGLYFTDTKDVAKGYRDALSPSSLPDGDSYGARTLLRVKGDEEGSRLFREAYRKGGLSDKEIEAALVDARIDLANPQGALYRTHLDVDPDSLLDWDKPLNEQNAIMDRLAGLHTPTGNMAEDARRQFSRSGVGKSNPLGSDLMGYLSSQGGSPKGGANSARQAGIPGIRYLDGDSRGNWQLSSPDTTVSEKWMVKDADIPLSNGRFFDNEQDALAELADRQAASHNYVMFDDKNISIQERGSATPEMLSYLAAAMTATPAAYSAKDNIEGYGQIARSLGHEVGNEITTGLAGLGSLIGGDGIDAAMGRKNQRIIPEYSPDSGAARASLEKLISALAGIDTSQIPALRGLELMGQGADYAGGQAADAGYPGIGTALKIAPDLLF